VSADAVVSIVAMMAWLILAIAGYRAEDVSRGKMLRQATIWTGIFGAAALAFRWLGL